MICYCNYLVDSENITGYSLASLFLGVEGKVPGHGPHGTLSVWFQGLKDLAPSHRIFGHPLKTLNVG